MGAKEPAGSEEVRFEDLDLVYIIPFDLGAPIEVKDTRKLSYLLSGIYESARDMLKFLLEELDGMSRTLYEEETLKKQEDFSRAQVELAARQEDLSRKQLLLTILFGVFGGLQAMEYLEPKLGFLPAFAVTLAIFTLIGLC
jgi:hypothetical protein